MRLHPFFISPIICRITPLPLLSPALLTRVITEHSLLHYCLSMNEDNLRKLMMLIIVCGLSLIGYGIYLIVSTDIVTADGTNGILKVAGLIAGGLFISVPAKIYLTLQLMRYNDEKLARERKEIENSHTV